MIRADFHFHPNFTFSNPRRTESRARAIWEAFEKNKLDMVLVTEHSYKQPQRTYETLLKFRDNHPTHIVPGAECLTKEGIDLIVFAREPEHLYSRTDILKPYGLTITEMADLISSNGSNLFGIVVHPHTPGETSIARIAGQETTLAVLEKLGFLEKHNGALTALALSFKLTGLRHIFKNKFSQMMETHTAPQYLCEKARVLTVGSDAHFPHDIGNASEISSEPSSNYDTLFDTITMQSGSFSESSSRSLLGLIPNGILTFQEYSMKTVGRIKN